MNFIDEAFLVVRAGNGGSGASSFRREKYIPFGGPDGGDGGKGGDIIFKVNTNTNTLIDFKNKKVIEAGNGTRGSGKNKTGAAGKDLILYVPKGTVIYDDISGQELLDCCDENEYYTIAKGGEGGLGNARFKTSTNQAPRKFTSGQEGEIREIRLELKSLADVGLVGYPNAGKSTFLNTVSSAKPKIGSYPFTTLRPHLGTIRGVESSYVVADIPGIIDGASEGAGLGINFLKHISRTGILLIFIDLSVFNENSATSQIKSLKNELKQYKEDLTKKTIWLVCNKIDLFEETELLRFKDEIKNSFDSHDLFMISAATGEGTEFLLKKLETEIFRVN